MAHHNTDLWRATGPIDFADSGMWPSGGAWLCDHLVGSLRIQRRQELSRRTVYPVMRGAAQFFLDTLQEDPTQSLAGDQSVRFAGKRASRRFGSDRRADDGFGNSARPVRQHHQGGDNSRRGRRFPENNSPPRATGSRRCKSVRRDSFRNGCKTGIMRPVRMFIIATCRIFTAFIRAGRSTFMTRRNWRRRRRNR